VGEPPEDVPRNPVIGVLPFAEADRDAAASADAMRRVGVELDRPCQPSLAAPFPPRVDGDSVYFVVEDAGNVHLYRAPLDSRATAELVVGGTGTVGEFDVRAGTIVYIGADTAQPPELFVNGVRRTHHTEPFLAATTLAPPIAFKAPSEGDEDVDCWLFLPPTGPGTDRGSNIDRHPVLLNIHGGPFSQYTNGFFDEFQIQAAAGYAVVACNPRGSSGRGNGWGRAVRGRLCHLDPGGGWAEPAMADVLSALDTALARWPERLDPDRVGVLGGSYGGYLTSWIVGHSDRFTAACSERAVNNMLTMCHTSDIGVWFNAGYVGVDVLTNPEELLRWSPVTYADAITTPLLILHSEEDWRCPVEQAEDLFTRLRLLGREVEFVRFPGENHELSRSGAPRHRQQRFEILLDFFDRHLKPAR
jgi:dipeptidyl aminopeptidase/acylaminoacyl peptidase